MSVCWHSGPCWAVGALTALEEELEKSTAIEAQLASVAIDAGHTAVSCSAAASVAAGNVLGILAVPECLSNSWELVSGIAEKASRAIGNLVGGAVKAIGNFFGGSSGDQAVPDGCRKRRRRSASRRRLTFFFGDSDDDYSWDDGWDDYSYSWGYAYYDYDDYSWGGGWDGGYSWDDDDGGDDDGGWWSPPSWDYSYDDDDYWDDYGWGYYYDDDDYWDDYGWGYYYDDDDYNYPPPSYFTPPSGSSGGGWGGYYYYDDDDYFDYSCNYYDDSGGSGRRRLQQDGTESGPEAGVISTEGLPPGLIKKLSSALRALRDFVVSADPPLNHNP